MPGGGGGLRVGRVLEAGRGPVGGSGLGLEGGSGFILEGGSPFGGSGFDLELRKGVVLIFSSGGGEVDFWRGTEEVLTVGFSWDGEGELVCSNLEWEGDGVAIAFSWRGRDEWDEIVLKFIFSKGAGADWRKEGLLAPLILLYCSKEVKSLEEAKSLESTPILNILEDFWVKFFCPFSKMNSDFFPFLWRQDSLSAKKRGTLLPVTFSKVWVKTVITSVPFSPQFAT